MNTHQMITTTYNGVNYQQINKGHIMSIMKQIKDISKNRLYQLLAFVAGVMCVEYWIIIIMQYLDKVDPQYDPDVYLSGNLSSLIMVFIIDFVFHYMTNQTSQNKDTL